MDTYTIRNLCFSYPEQQAKAIDNFTLTVPQGAFIVLCGPSGCGKSTLLRQLKTVLTPHGHRTGDILFEGALLDAQDIRTQSQKIGFVGQSPENQIVTDKVWHELAFGLESLGCDTPTIRRKVAEMASFFGIEAWFYKNVTELSGGQKQLLNLASVMTMSPSVLILDEPTSQLDPIAASDFLAVLGRINRELGTTVILTEHRLEEAFPLASEVAVMECGRLLCCDTPQSVGKHLKTLGHTMFLAMPAAMRIWAAVETDTDSESPITVREGRDWFSAFAAANTIQALPAEDKHIYPDGVVLSADDVWFRYEKDAPDVVRGLHLSVKKGEFFALMGGNGTGKTTALKLLAGMYKPYRGDIQRNGSIGVLPQNPQTLFVKKTVREDLFELLRECGRSREEQQKRFSAMVRMCRLEGLLERHPYDLSGGEQQRAALAKVLLLDPDILFMDEPTKGLDAEFKQEFAEILQVLLHRGVTVVMVSHDVEFCARYAHRCALFFDGNIVTQDTPRKFFAGNNFYTTSANRMARATVPDAVTPEDLIYICGGEIPEKASLPDDDIPVPESTKTADVKKTKPFPFWRKLTAIVSGILAVVLLIQAVGVTDLTALIDAEGMTAMADDQLKLYLWTVCAMLIFALTVSRRTERPDYALQSPREKRRLSRRTAAAAGLILLLIPLTLFVGETYLDGRKYYFISLLILLECMIPFFLIFESRKPQARELVIIAVLCAIGVAGRAAFFMLPQFKPVMALTIIAGVAFGGETGFLVGAMTMLVSNVLFSQGPWTPWQMFCMGIIGFLSGVLFRKGLLRRSRVSLCMFGALSAVIIYGGIMNSASALMWAGEIRWETILTYCISGFPIDGIHAAATWIFLWFAAEPMLEKFDRIKIKYGLVE